MTRTVLAKYAVFSGLPLLEFLQPTIQENLEEVEQFGIRPFDSDYGVELEEGVEVKCGRKAEGVSDELGSGRLGRVRRCREALDVEEGVGI
jgi:hypothetical protein